jgi:uncharacterized protein (TIGR04222 family)
MDNILWEKITAFDLDDPISEYGFSTRLAAENYWTKDFTAKAILEYKKFMYLAGTSDFMVSPSEIVDTVWHQHLIFTKSYADLCQIIGKTVQHIPSTHNREDFEKFQQAKERTKKLYASTFGQQPAEIWEYAGMYEALNLPKSKFKIRTFVIFGVLTMMACLVPFYFLLKPIYVHIDNPYFIVGYFFSIPVISIGLSMFNYFHLAAIVKTFERCTFIHSLAPMELVYLKTQKLDNVIHGHVSQLVDTGAITVVQKNQALKIGSITKPLSIEEYTIFEALKHSGPVSYHVLLQQLKSKPAFDNISNSMDAFKKYFTKSTAFGKLFYVNFAVYAFVIMLALTRLLTGLTRGKPVEVLVLVLFVMTALAVSRLLALTKSICTDTIPKFYKNDILPNEKNRDAWPWRFFLLGPTVLSASIAPLVESYDASLYRDSSSGWGSSDSSSCGSSCGSSCSSCGGCGGD